MAYGHILSQAIIDLPPRGTINIHASLLPLLRGAAPIQAAIRDGHAETGVTIMRMVKALDAGPSIVQARTPVADDETYGELRLRLAELGAMALIEALALIELGRAEETPQDESKATYAPKIDRAMARVDWTADAATVSRLVRAFDPRPGAFAVRSAGEASQEVKLFGASVAPRTSDSLPGEVLAIDDLGMTVACGAAGGEAVPCKLQACSPPGSARCRRASGRAAGASRSARGYLRHHAWRRSGPVARRRCWRRSSRCSRGRRRGECNGGAQRASQAGRAERDRRAARRGRRVRGSSRR